MCLCNVLTAGVASISLLFGQASVGESFAYYSAGQAVSIHTHLIQPHVIYGHMQTEYYLSVTCVKINGNHVTKRPQIYYSKCIFSSISICLTAFYVS